MKLIYEFILILNRKTQLCLYIVDAFSGNSPSWKPELAIVQYSPKMVNNSSESQDEGNSMVNYQYSRNQECVCYNAAES